MTLELRVVAYSNKGYNEEVHTFTNALNDLLCFAAAWTQLKRPLLTQLSSSFITVHSVLHLQKLQNNNDHYFNQTRVRIPFTDCYLRVIQLVGTPKVIKSDKSGLVYLGAEDKFGGCWIQSTSSGK